MSEFSAAVKELQTENATKDMATSVSNNDSGEAAISMELNIPRCFSASHNGSFVSSVACQTISTSSSLASPESLSSVHSLDGHSPSQANSLPISGNMVDNDMLQVILSGDTAACNINHCNETLLHESMLTDKTGVPSPSLSGFSMSSDCSPVSSAMLSTAQQGFSPVDMFIDFTNSSSTCGSTLDTLSPYNSESAVGTDPMLLNTFPSGIVPQAPQTEFNLLIPSSFDFSANTAAHNPANSEYLPRLDDSKCIPEVHMFDTSSLPINLSDPVVQQLLGEVMDNSDFSTTPLFSDGHKEIDSHDIKQAAVTPEVCTLQHNAQVQLNASNVKLSSDSLTDSFTSYPSPSPEVQDILQQFV